MRMTMDTAAVEGCEAIECAFNNERACHAQAITIGNLLPSCDTYCYSTSHTARPGLAGVGACKVARCRHNEDLTCTAAAVRIGHRARGVNCLTFEARAS